MGLTHYLVVRRDLPFGALLAQLAHAAGESFYQLAEVAQKKERPGPGAGASVTTFVAVPEPGEVAGSSPALGSISGGGERRLTSDGASRSGEVGSQPAYPANFNPNQTTVVVLGARNEQKLLRLQAQLRLAEVPFVAIREPDPPFFGALTAIGLVPGLKAELAPYVREFHMIRTLDQDADR